MLLICKRRDGFIFFSFRDILYYAGLSRAKVEKLKSTRHLRYAGLSGAKVELQNLHVFLDRKIHVNFNFSTFAPLKPAYL